MPPRPVISTIFRSRGTYHASPPQGYPPRVTARAYRAHKGCVKDGRLPQWRAKGPTVEGAEECCVGGGGTDQVPSEEGYPKVYGVFLDEEGVEGLGPRVLHTRQEWLAELERAGEVPSDADQEGQKDEDEPAMAEAVAM